MTLLELQSKVADITGLTNLDRLTSAIQLAANEIWDTIDLPDTLQEIRVCTDSERYVTLPWQVYKIRGARSSEGRMHLEVNTIHPFYQDMQFYQGLYTCRIIRKVPLARKITNASTITFKLRRVQPQPVTFTVVGEVDYASRVVEPITLPANVRSVESVERFINIPESITKSIRTLADVDLLDADDNTLATFPNHLLASTYLLAQLYDSCSLVAGPFTGTFDILFKPHCPALDSPTDAFPDPWSQIIIFKAIEQIMLQKEDSLEIANAYNSKAVALTNQFTADNARGRTVRMKTPLDRLTTVYYGRI